MKVIRRIIIGFSVALFVVCCGAIVLFNWSVTGWKALTVATGSMSPSIPTGSVVLMHSVPSSSLKTGDVITYTNPQNMRTTITHRIAETYKTNGTVPTFITKGDANSTADQPIVGGLVKGKVIWSVPYLGRWLNLTKSPVVLSLLVYIPALIIMVEELRRLNTYYKRLVPYKAAIILAREKTTPKGKQVFAAASVISLALLAGSALLPFKVYAMLSSNMVSLVSNRVTLAQAPANVCTGNGNTTSATINISGGNSSNNNNANVNNSSSQNAQSGNATVSGNGTGGSATSGNATNCNNTNININITNP